MNYITGTIFFLNVTVIGKNITFYFTKKHRVLLPLAVSRGMADFAQFLLVDIGQYYTINVPCVH